jgi:hypothetical protein
MKCNNFYKTKFNKFVLLLLLIVSIEVQSLEQNISSDFNNFSVITYLIYFIKISDGKNIQEKTY